jgi:hypothetical protein
MKDCRNGKNREDRRESKMIEEDRRRLKKIERD